jgi:hypothetical protein
VQRTRVAADALSAAPAACCLPPSDRWSATYTPTWFTGWPPRVFTALHLFQSLKYYYG